MHKWNVADKGIIMTALCRKITDSSRRTWHPLVAVLAMPSKPSISAYVWNVTAKTQRNLIVPRNDSPITSCEYEKY